MRTEPPFGMKDLDGIYAAASRLRAAFDAAADLVSVSFALFPRGACGDAAILLGQYLEDSGLGVWTYVSGSARADTPVHGTHGWIEQDGVIAEITADQFDDVTTPVIVTTDRRWHDQFQRIGGSGHPANLTGWTGAKGALTADYRRLVARLEPDAVGPVDP